jgi:NADPH:quinone reductase
MHAVGVRKFGAVPELLAVPVPSPAEGEILVRLDAAGINPFDWKISDGLFRDKRPHVFPLILGVDGAGTVSEVGPTAERFQVGDRVFGQFLHDPVGRGTYAESVVVPEGNALVLIPPKLTSAVAAALPTAGMAALDCLEDLQLARGQTLLAVGASGGIGSIAVPLAAAAGVRVLAVARAASQERLRTLGAAESIDVASPDPVGEVRRLAPQGVDALLVMAGDASDFARWAAVVRPAGVAVSTIYTAGKIPGIRAENLNLQPRADLLERLVRAVAEGKVRSPVERTIPLSEAPAAVAEGRAGNLSGKTVIRLNPDVA